jgi:ceramide glucosyltransferase
MVVLLDHLARVLGLVLAAAASAYLVLANWCVRRFDLARLTARRPAAVLPALTVLKPLHGDETDLEANLESFLQQAYPGKLQIVFGVQSEHDPALGVARRLAARYPDRDIAVVVDPTVHGPNRKAGNLANMAAVAGHDLIAVSDSDARLQPDGLARAVEPLADPGVGAVTCLYRSAVPRGAGWAARLAGLYIDGWILPSAVVAAALGPVEGCYGPLTVIRRGVLEGAGGFARLSHLLADDHELGQITVRQGLRVELAPCIVPTMVHETSLEELCRHELRWARTTRATEPLAYAFSVVTWTAPLIALLLLPTGRPIQGLLMLALLIGLRAALLINVQRRLNASIGLPELAPWAIVAREALCFAIWAAAYFGGRISWRGASLEVRPGGRLVEPAPSGAR